ncbi:MAG TPA: VWA domain-containing protein [Myxococcales bacterium]|nr:VWA domain-containing protein [Myxococcales bacterium]
MDARLAEFVGLLRQNGVRVSPAEVADAARATLLVGVEERDPFRSALRATLVKRGPDAVVFDRLFDLYFLGIKDLVDGLSGALLDALAAEKLTELELEEAARVLSEMRLSSLTEALVKGRADQLARLLRQATLNLDFRGLQSPLQRGFYARRLLQAAGGTRAEQELQEFLLRLKQQGFDPGSLEVVSRRVSETLKGLEEAARRVADREQKARDPEQKGESGLLQRNLASLTPAEVERMRAVVRRLAERLKTRLTRKRKVRRRGVLSVRRTLRKNLSTGGFPARLVFRSKRPERPEILVLCDVSDSVRNVSRLMLQFVYTLQELYSRVRSFVFVSDIGEVTDLFKKMDVSSAVDLATASRVINVAANSNYGHALRMFHSTWLGSVTRRSTVIVIGDGRTNYNPPNAWVLGEVKRKARRLIWLCPEDPGSWGFGDSEMPLYARHCTRVEVVKSVDDLGRVAAELLP